MKHFQFVQNRECEFFPCHQGIDQDLFNCLFCYCPLYPLGEDCGGHIHYRKNGVKDCSLCSLPHNADGYAFVQCRIGQVVNMVKRVQKNEK